MNILPFDYHCFTYEYKSGDKIIMRKQFYTRNGVTYWYYNCGKRISVECDTMNCYYNNFNSVPFVVKDYIKSYYMYRYLTQIGVMYGCSYNYI